MFNVSYPLVFEGASGTSQCNGVLVRSPLSVLSQVETNGAETHKKCGVETLLAWRHVAGTDYILVLTVAEAPWSVAEWAVALRFDHPRATVLVLSLGTAATRVTTSFEFWGSKRPKHP